MKKTILFLFLWIGSVVLSFGQTKGDAIIGEWMNEQKDAKFQIIKQDGSYFGKIIWGTGDQNKDSKNPDSKLRNRALIGLVILKNFVFDGKNTWEDGTIYDPREGKTYSCNITLKGINQMHLRGFVGISLFGRTEIWHRIK